MSSAFFLNAHREYNKYYAANIIYSKYNTATKRHLHDSCYYKPTSSHYRLSLFSIIRNHPTQADAVHHKLTPFTLTKHSTKLTQSTTSCHYSLQPDTTPLHPDTIHKKATIIHYNTSPHSTIIHCTLPATTLGYNPSKCTTIPSHQSAFPPQFPPTTIRHQKRQQSLQKLTTISDKL